MLKSYKIVPKVICLTFNLLYLFVKEFTTCLNLRFLTKIRIFMFNIYNFIRNKYKT